MSRKRATQITDQSPTSKPFLTFMERYSQIRSQRPVLQEFYGKRWVRRHQRLGAWKKKDVQRRLITNENRQFKPKTLVRAIGHAGTGVGTRTTGHLRYGGNWHRRFAAQQGIVLVTNEARTSMVCPFCRCRVMHPRKVKGGSESTQGMDDSLEFDVLG
ncbi:uncharacterized protein BYT42DRAFT_637710 [Radiomyces spectabilis]|uniref:uncharacterized protein n=1 Tax=Radiomyces spectabilis TaxID=64574 RepID=UPI0022203DCC|nr:uncharacterized protein BYT42DRAFT_637710 [Radiomyces spectabilis]KAI8378064.1 hypothetical protein BYT42DRAFT_637710 [Radiomyces spectabilis]